jgi:methionine synthase I (cobalamin-dependent)
MTREAFRARLAQGALVADGAMGTMLALRGVPHTPKWYAPCIASITKQARA